MECLKGLVGGGDEKTKGNSEAEKKRRKKRQRDTWYVLVRNSSIVLTVRSIWLLFSLFLSYSY